MAAELKLGRVGLKGREFTDVLGSVFDALASRWLSVLLLARLLMHLQSQI